LIFDLLTGGATENRQPLKKIREKEVVLDCKRLIQDGGVEGPIRDAWAQWAELKIVKNTVSAS
jgi:hypothetical protein